MPVGNIIGADLPGGAIMRTEPIQRRSADRLNTLLDAAAEIVDETGFDRLTTAMIADRSGASIGTVYRYFPDRIAVLQALRERAVLRFRTRIVELMEAESPDHWWDAVDCGVTAFVGLYRSEPGFRIIHFRDRERTTPDVIAAQPQPLATSFAAVLTEAYGLEGVEELAFRLDVTIGIADAILARAFSVDPNGDERYIAECRRVMRDYLVGHYGAVPAAV